MSPNAQKLGKRTLALAVAAAIHPAVAQAQSAGHIDFAIGNVSAIAANSSQRNLRKGMDVNAGDTIVTNNNARVQIRFSDGGYISLQPNTRFKIDEYRFGGAADGKERSFFSLVKGGLRAITGAIGKGNRANYQLQTPVATIGIRGTHFRARICEGDCIVLNRAVRDGLYVSVGEGKISLNNAAGKTDLDQGGAAFVADKNSTPTRVEYPNPQLPRIDSEPRYVSGEDRNESGQPATLFGFTRTFDPAAGAIVIDGATSPAFNRATVDDRGQMFSFQQTPGGPEIFYGSASILDAGTTGLISWGRWSGGQTTLNAAGAPYDLTGGRSLHYVVTDALTPTAFITSGSSAVLNYNLAGATTPTSDTGRSGVVTGGTLRLTLSATPLLEIPSLTMDLGSNTYSTSASFSISSAVFSGTGTTTGACASSCSAAISGVFAGANAESAGLTYKISGTPDGTISGAAGFRR